MGMMVDGRCFCLYQMRKFVAEWSAGLRVRLNPSLQSEQIGVVRPNGVLSFIDEVSDKELCTSGKWSATDHFSMLLRSCAGVLVVKIIIGLVMSCKKTM